MTDDDVPSPIDLRDPIDAATWIAEADVKRPWRADVRRAIAERVVEAGRARVLDAAKLGILDAARLHVLELGPGPGLLAEVILDACDVERYVLFDFSPPMLDAARARLGDRAQYVLGDYRTEDWGLEGPFDAIVAMQSMHEVRHKRHVPAVYARARALMRPGSMIVVCDHEPMDARPLYSTAEEQIAALTSAGLVNATLHARFEGLYVISAGRA